MILGLMLACLWVIADQWTKHWAVATLQGNDPQWLLGGTLRFHYLENHGAAFGLLQGQTFLFALFTVVVVAGLLFFLWRYHKKTLWLAVAIGLILGGAVGNLIDRMSTGYVVDFIEVDLVAFFHFPIFNVADIGVTIGVFLLAILLLIIPEREWGKR